MKRPLSVATFLLASVAALDAHADLLNWSAGIAYDSGVSPVVAAGTTDVGEWAIEVHQGQAGAGPLWYRSGEAAGNGRPILQNGHQFDWGFAPALASVGNNPNIPSVVEVHQGQAGAGPLWYSVGWMLNNSAPGTLTWSSGNAYDIGFAPAIAAAGNTVVELHQAGAGAGEMMYQVGTVSGSSVSWNPPYALEYGVAPSVAVMPSPYNSGTTYVIEVHQGGEGFGPLWYSVGTLNGTSITWTHSAIYDYGVAPRIAVFQDRVIEVHEGQNGPGPLWYHLANLTGPYIDFPSPGNTLLWDANAHEYASGFAPAVAFDPVSVQGYETHQVAGGFGLLEEQIFTTRPAVPQYQQAEANWCWVTAAEMVVQTLRGLTLANGPSAAAELECQAIDYNEIVGGQGGNNNGAFLDCCGPGAFDPSSWTYCECNRGGDYTGVFNESGVSYSNVYTVGVPDTSAAIPFAQMQNEIANGRPVPFGLTWNPPGNGGHYMVIVGTEVDEGGGEWVVVNDAEGMQWTFPYIVFSNTNTSVDPWPFVVTEMATNLRLK